MSHQALSVGDKWWEMGHPHKMNKQRPKHLNFKLLGPQVMGQQVAHDTLPQALWHDLMMTNLLKQTEYMD